MFMELFLSLATIIIFSIFALKPTILTIIELTKEIKSKEETITKMDTKIKNLNQAQKIYNQQQENIKFLNQAMPKEPSVETFAKQIESVSTSDSVNLVNFSMDRAALVGEDTRKKSKDVLELIPEGSDAIAFSLTFNGSFSSLITLLGHLETMRRPLIIQGVTLSTSSKEEVAIDNLNFTLNGQLPYLGSGSNTKTANAKK